MHKKLALASLAIPLAAVALSPRGADAQATGIVTLTELRHHSRPLLIFAPKPDDSQLEIQMRRLNEAAPAIAEREIVAIALPYESPSTTSAQLTTDEATATRRRFNIAPTDFAVILIGKDGGQKLRSTTPLTLDQLREVVDAMPMRQDEIRAHSHK